MRIVVAMHCGLLAALSVGCGRSAQEQLKANKELVRQFAASVDAGDWAAFDTLVAADIRRHSRATTASPEIRSREQFKRHEQARHTPWPDGHVTYDIMVAEGDFVAAYATFTGTHRGPLGTFAPTGRPVETQFLALFRVQDGQIAEIWVEWDNIATLTQLGLYPPADRRDGG
jgi:predicted ester cyclase